MSELEKKEEAIKDECLTENTSEKKSDRLVNKKSAIFIIGGLAVAGLVAGLFIGKGIVNKKNLQVATAYIDEYEKEQEELRLKAEEEKKQKEKQAQDEKFDDAIEKFYSNPEEAILFFEDLSKEGNEDATFMLGFYYDRICHGENDGYTKSKEYYEQVENENPYAKICLGFLHKYGNGVLVNPVKSQEYFEDALASLDGSAIETLPYKGIAYYILGDFYKSGGDEYYDEEKINKYLDMAAESENACVMHLVGVDYAFLDSSKAIALLEKTAELGNSVSMRWLGTIYSVVENDDSKSLEWLEKAADAGNSSAMWQLGNNYFNGYGGVEADVAKGLEWYEKAAELGDADAMRELGDAYMYGDGGIDIDKEKGFEWYEKAAELGDADAMCELGDAYRFGCGVDYDEAKSQEWFKKAAELGNAYAHGAVIW